MQRLGASSFGFAVSGILAEECKLALSVWGHDSSELDLDFQFHGFWDGTPSYLGPENGLHPYKERVIQFGCDTPSDFSQGDRGGMCTDADLDRARGKWIIVSSKTMWNLTDTVELAAICVDGCPVDGTWPAYGVFEPRWELTGECDSLPASGTIDTTARCCGSWGPTCEKNKCSNRTLDGDVYNPRCSVDSCCYWHAYNQFTGHGECRAQEQCLDETMVL